MTKGKYIICSFLLFILSVPFATPIIFQVNILLIKMEAKERFEMNNLETFRIKKADVSWTDAGKEMRINDRLFDVEEYKDNGDEFLVKGLFDDSETALEKQIEQLWDQQKSKNGILLLKYFQFLSNNYLQQTYYHFEPYSIVPVIYGTGLILSEQNICIKIPSPPPQV